MSVKRNGEPATVLVAGDDSHFKTCKKIAQLTKVIYTLNCRNEDNEERVQWIARNHQEELKRMMEECERRVADANSRAAKAERAKQEFIQALEQRHKALMMEAKSEYTQKAATMLQQLEKEKQSYTEKVKEMRQSDDERLREEIEALRKTKDDSTANLVKEYNERYNAMLVEQMDLRDTLERTLTENWEKKLSALSDELSATQAQLQSQLGDRNQALQDATGKNMLLSKQLAAAKEAADSLEMRLGQLTREKKDLEEKLNSQRASCDTTKEAVASAEQRAAELAETLAEAKKNLSQCQTEVDHLRISAERMGADLTAAENARSAAETARQRAEHEVAELEAARDELEAARKELEARVEELTAQLASLGSSAAGTESTLSDLLAQLDAAKEALRETEDRHRDEVKELNDLHAKALTEARSQSREHTDAIVERLTKEKEADAEEHQKALAALQDEHRRIVLELEQAAAQQKASYESQLEQNGSHNSSMAEELARARAEGEAARASLHQLGEKFDQLTKTTDAQAASDLETINRLTADLKKLEESEANIVEEQRRALAIEEQRAKKERDDLIAAHARREKEIRDEAAKATAAANMAHLQELEKLRQAQLTATREATALANQRLSQMSSDTQQRMNEAREAAERQLRELRHSSEAAVEALQSRVDTLERQLELANTATASEKVTGAKALLEKEEQLGALRAEMERLRKEHTMALDTHRQTAEERLKRSIAEMDAAHTAELEKLRLDAKKTSNMHSADMAQTCQEYEEKLKRAEDVHRDELEACKAQAAKDHQEFADSMNAVHNSRIRELENTAKANVARLQHQLDGTTTDLSTARDRIDMLAVDLDCAKQENEAVRRQLEEELKQAEAARAAALAAHRDALERAEKENTLQLNRVAAEHKRIIDEFTAQRTGEREAHRSMTDQLKTAYDELLYKYQFRESRPEDVELINKLLKDNHDKDKALTKAHEDMKLYKLELINREENYNKLFGRRPVVADAYSVSASPAVEANTSVAAGSRSLPMIHPPRQSAEKQPIANSSRHRFSK